MTQLTGGQEMKIRTDKMPTTLALLVFSWAIVFFGLLMSGYVLFFTPAGTHALIAGFSVLLGALSLALVLRMLGNIGQILFDTKNYLLNDHQGQLQKGLQGIRKISDDIEKIAHDLKEISDNLEKLSCDSKDINQDIGHIKFFFEKIERHLDLKK